MRVGTSRNQYYRNNRWELLTKSLCCGADDAVVAGIVRPADKEGC